MSNKVIPLPAFKDNYIWLFYDEVTRDAWVVDPGDAAPVIETLERLKLTLCGILITHHHHDHSGGVNVLIQHWDNVTVVGSHKSPVQSITHHVKENDEIICLPFTLRTLEIPGHTLDHLAFYNSEVLFCGDTLFSFGCGRIFEGTPEQMYRSLNKLLQLSETIQVYCGHEYTLANLRFAQHVEPQNIMLADKIQETVQLRERNLPTLPTTLSIEKQLNPFLRCNQPSIAQAVKQHCNKDLNNPIDIFANLRAWKNSHLL